MRNRHVVSLLFALSPLLAGPALGQASLRTHDREVVRLAAVQKSAAMSTPSSATVASECNLTVRATDGIPVAGGGQLAVSPAFDPATVNAAGQVAFFSQVVGSNRNQGVFLADAMGLHAVAIGCGGGGGSGNPGTVCGDPSPIGGRFTGFFGGTVFAPDVNDQGDVLFLADVFGGSAPRGLFLRHGGGGSIVKVAAIGDPSPTGGVFAVVGPGSLNDLGQVAFLASSGAAPPVASVNVYLWQAGTVSTVRKVGDNIAGSGTISALGTEWNGFVDGTSIPIGPVPDINDAGQVAFRAIFTNGSRGLYVQTSGVPVAYVKSGEPTPMGGQYFDIWAPILNAGGEIAFEADVQLGPGVFTGGWVVGTPGDWRKALEFSDPLDGGQVSILAVSRNPMQPLNDGGDLLLWCDLNPNGGEERLVLSRADGSLEILAREGESTPAGPIGFMQAWPSTSNCFGLLSTNLAHMTLDAAAGEVPTLTASQEPPGSGNVELSWPDSGGTCAFTASFDVARGSLETLQASGYPGGAVCAADDLDGAPYLEPDAACAVGDEAGCWYLVRAGSACGPATWGPAELDAASPCP